MHIARAGHVRRICTSFYFFQTAGQNNGPTRLKLCDLSAPIGGHLSLWLPVLGGTSSTRQRGEAINIGSSEFVKFLPRSTKLGALLHYEKGITAIRTKLNWGACCTCIARDRNLLLYPCFQGYRANHLLHRIETWWVVRHHGWEHITVLASVDRCKVHVPRGRGDLPCVRSSELQFLSKMLQTRHTGTI